MTWAISLWILPLGLCVRRKKQLRDSHQRITAGVLVANTKKISLAPNLADFLLSRRLPCNNHMRTGK